MSLAVYDLKCKECGAVFPATPMRGTVESARCGVCGQKSMRVSWSRGKAPGTSVFRGVKVPDGREIGSVDELQARTQQLMARNPDARVVFDDDNAAHQQRIDDARHTAWQFNRDAGIDAAVIAEAKATGQSPLDVAKLNRFGTTDPEPTLVKELGIEVKIDYAAPRPEAGCEAQFVPEP